MSDHNPKWTLRGGSWTGRNATVDRARRQILRHRLERGPRPVVTIVVHPDRRSEFWPVAIDQWRRRYEQTSRGRG